MIETFTFTNVKYVRGQYNPQAGISFTCNGHAQMSVANNSVGNKHYDELMRQVNAGTLTISAAEPADSEE